MAFADILKTFKKPVDNGGVLAKVDRYLLQLDGKLMNNKEDERAKGVYHPSELSTNPCTRSMVYRWIEAPSVNKPIQPRVKRIFDVGHHFGFIKQQYFWDMGILQGMWHCVKCEHEWWDISPRKCPSCNVDLEIWYNLRYDEVPIRNEKWNITGSADGIISLDDEVLIELKSIKNRDSKTSDKAVTFEDLSSAKLEHVYQANLYMDARGIDRGLIIYFAKNTQETKEFPIRRMDMMLQPSYNKIIEVEHSKTNRILPPRAGSMKSDPICTYCPFKEFCWSSEHTFDDADCREKVTV